MSAPSLASHPGGFHVPPRSPTALSPPSERRARSNAFRPRVERLEDREVPATHSYTVNVSADTRYHHFDEDDNRPEDVNHNCSLRACVEYATMNPETGNPSVNNYLVTLPFGVITLDPDLGSLSIGTNMS